LLDCDPPDDRDHRCITRNVAEKVKDTISQLVGEALHIDPGTIVQDTDLFAAGLRSLDLVNLVVALEATFGFQFPEEALNRETFASPASITDMVIRCRTI